MNFEQLALSALRLWWLDLRHARLDLRHARLDLRQARPPRSSKDLAAQPAAANLNGSKPADSTYLTCSLDF
jgi:hypothetical protein